MAEKETVTERSGIVSTVDYRREFPWHAQPWGVLTRDLARLPHALLLYGPAGLGKTAFAWRLARALLCRQPKRPLAACGACPGCALFDAGTHPDLLSVTPMEDAAGISVDQIREIKDFVVLKPHSADRKIVIIEPADSMNMNATNALLKVLEEPPPGSLLLLVSSQPGRLSATVRSRVGRVSFRSPEQTEGVAWVQAAGVEREKAAMYLRRAGGAPLRALEYATDSDIANPAELQRDIEALKAGNEDPLRCASRWKGLGSKDCMAWFQGYLAMLIQDKVQVAGKTFPLYLKDLYKFIDTVSDVKAQLDGPLDETLLLEDVLISWCRISRRIV